MSNGTEKMFRKTKLDEAIHLVAQHYDLTTEEVKSILKTQYNNDTWNRGG